ncbi:MAG: hypothetical protein JSU86_20120 [Phycisphaerales bacterium]|nr:MAG: hypothetical protein JSU86_20120 [Phycisphaerales bacterium]
MTIMVVAVFSVVVWSAFASSYEGQAFPEQIGWTRQGSGTALRTVGEGWLIQEIRGWYDPPVMNGGDHDSYLRHISEYEGGAFFAEWRMMSDAPAGEVDHHNGAALMVMVGGPVTYHFNMANGLARLIRGYQFPGLYFLIEPEVPHTYRLEVFGGDWFELWIDGTLAAADVPEDVFPTADALMSFGGTYYMSGHTTRWDYVRYGRIPVDGSGDYDSDEDVDGRDFYFFHECLSNARPGINGGPGNDAGPGCRFADFDSDNDVDLHDTATFQRTFTGGQ